MDSHTSETSLASDQDAAFLEDVWSSPVTAQEPSDPLYQSLAGTAILVAPCGREAVTDDGDPQEELRLQNSVTEILGLLVGLLSAERAFLFTTEADTTGLKERLQVNCLTAIDLDGEPINQPEKKVSREVLLGVARSGIPVTQDSPPRVDTKAAEQDPPTAEGAVPSYFAGLPVVMEKQVAAVVFVENRFRPLHLTRETALMARVHCRVLAGLMEIQRLRKENRSLWNDVSRMLEAQPQTTEAASLVTHKPRRSTSAKRSDLKGDYSMIVGSSPRMIEIFQTLDRISASGAPVLINGDSGTGKELIAHAIHNNSKRIDDPFVSENCGALTETLLESELFGYMKGSFTGATKDRKGLFELADRGTLFLDEVGDMSSTMQKKLLRVLQERVVRRVGGKDFIPVDVRIISATNKDLMAEVRNGNFREDLYYRLNVINIKLPPLRDRKEDLPEIAESILAALVEEYGEPKSIEPAAMARLAEHNWPGNIRELQNEIKRVYALCDGDVKVSDLSDEILRGRDDSHNLTNLESELTNLTLKEAVERVEEHMIRTALVDCRGNKSLVAKELQVPKTSLYNKINKYDLNRI